MKLARPATHVIFDLDGVLLDTEPLYTRATSAVTDRYGKHYGWNTKADCIGRGTMEAARIVVEALGLPLSAEDLVRERDLVLVRLLAHVPVVRGAEAFTRGLATRGIPMAIATSTEAALYAIKTAAHKRWLSLFRVVICGDDPRVRHPKPAPDIFLAAARELAADPGACLVIEDSPFGVQAARAAGMQVVAVPDPAMDRTRYADADLVVGGFSALGLSDLGF